MPPIPISGAGAEPFSAGISVTNVSVVNTKPAMEPAACKAFRVTLTGSITPASIKSVYSFTLDIPHIFCL